MIELRCVSTFETIFRLIIRTQGEIWCSLTKTWVYSTIESIWHDTWIVFPLNFPYQPLKFTFSGRERFWFFTSQLLKKFCLYLKHFFSVIAFSDTFSVVINLNAFSDMSTAKREKTVKTQIKPKLIADVLHFFQIYCRPWTRQRLIITQHLTSIWLGSMAVELCMCVGHKFIINLLHEPPNIVPLIKSTTFTLTDFVYVVISDNNNKHKNVY